MAASIQAAAAGLSFIAPASQPPCNSSQGSNASRQSVGGPVKSHFFGSARALGNVGSSKHLTPATAGANPIVSASFFEKLGKLFTDAPEGSLLSRADVLSTVERPRSFSTSIEV